MSMTLNEVKKERLPIFQTTNMKQVQIDPCDFRRFNQPKIITITFVGLSRCLYVDFYSRAYHRKGARNLMLLPQEPQKHPIYPANSSPQYGQYITWKRNNVTA